MSTTAIVLTSVLGAAVLFVVARAVLAGWRRGRGTRVVRCPATHLPAAIELDRWRALRTGALEVRSCSDWPEREGCAQSCLAEIEAAPDGCRVKSLLTSWYAGQRCALCGEPFGKIHWLDRPPALLDSAGATRGWDEIRPEILPRVLETHRPVCADCRLADRFRREHADRFVDRPGRRPLRRAH